MFNIFNSNVFIEIGEAIGTAGKVILRKNKNPGIVDEMFRKRLQELTLKLPLQGGRFGRPDTIDAEFRILSDEEVRCE